MEKVETDSLLILQRILHTILLSTGLLQDAAPGRIMDQFSSIKTLEEVMLPYTEEEMHLKWVFQQENDPIHTNK